MRTQVLAAPSHPRPGVVGIAARLAAFAIVAAGAAVVIAAQADGDKKGIGGVLRFREDGNGITVYGGVLLALFIAVTATLVGTLVAAGRDRSLLISGWALAKVLLLLSVVFMFAFPDLSQFEGKSLTYRAVLYPTLGYLPMALYAWRGRPGPFPFVLDFCLTFALTFDIVSNDLHWYGTWLHWDDTVHFFNTFPIMILVTAVFLSLEHVGRIRLGFWGCFFFAFCVYALVHSLWEMEEFALDRFLGTNLQPGGMEEATRNNIAGLVASMLTAAILLWWRRLGELEARVSAPFGEYAGRVRRGRSRDS